MTSFRFLTIIAIAALLAGCRGRQSVASKSAAAYREAIAKGVDVEAGGHTHGGHTHEEAAKSPATMAGMDHAKAQSGAMANMAGMDHSKMQHGPTKNMPNMAGMDHGSMAGMDHSKMQHGSTMASMPGMQHGSMPGMNMAGMQHGATSAASVVLAAPSTSAGIAGLSPSSTLKEDALDAPAAVGEVSKPSPPMKHQERP